MKILNSRPVTCQKASPVNLLIQVALSRKDHDNQERSREIGSGPVGGHFEKRTRDVSP